ncbi:hypothetical protein [Nostoc sp. CHAB 5715]|nr:hypothetical protein [Nostoc sp. CHAB 5715]
MGHWALGIEKRQTGKLFSLAPCCQQELPVLLSVLDGKNKI